MFFLLFASLGLSGIVRADDSVLTPDGYLGHPAFEFGLNGDPTGNSFTQNYSYTNYTTFGNVAGTGNFNANHVFLNIYYPVSSTFTFSLGGSYLINASGVSTYQGTANNFTGTENGVSNYTYANTLSWYVACKIYTK